MMMMMRHGIRLRGVLGHFPHSFANHRSCLIKGIITGGHETILEILGAEHWGAIILLP
jgi:hypothetical protein